jgi:hypothetical protein
LFNRLARNGVFGASGADSDSVQAQVALDKRDRKQRLFSLDKQRQIFEDTVQSVWLTPVVICVALATTIYVGFDYTSPPGPHSFINSSPAIFAFNEALWFIEMYMVGMSFMRYILLTVWLTKLLKQWRLKIDVLWPDGRMGFSPITDCAILATKTLIVALVFLVFVLKGAHNIGVPINTPEWLFYLGLVIGSLPFVVGPIYIAHRLMLREREYITADLIRESGYPHTIDVIGSAADSGDTERNQWLLAQVAFIRLAQVKDWPVTVDEAVTVIFGYLLGTAFTLLSSFKSVLDFIFR